MSEQALDNHFELPEEERRAHLERKQAFIAHFISEAAFGGMFAFKLKRSKANIERELAGLDDHAAAENVFPIVDNS